MDVEEQGRNEDVDFGVPDEQIQFILDSSLEHHVSVLYEASTYAQAEDASDNGKLDRPLLSMLPSEYANTNVEELFPHFRKNKPVRFLQIFESGRVEWAAGYWQGAKKNLEELKQYEMKNLDANSDEETKQVVSQVLNI